MDMRLRSRWQAASSGGPAAGPSFRPFLKLCLSVSIPYLAQHRQVLGLVRRHSRSLRAPSTFIPLTLCSFGPVRPVVPRVDPVSQSSPPPPPPLSILLVAVVEYDAKHKGSILAWYWYQGTWYHMTIGLISAFFQGCVRMVGAADCDSMVQECESIVDPIDFLPQGLALVIYV